MKDQSLRKESFPDYLEFEQMTDTFFTLLKDRYPSPDKILQVISRQNADNIHDKIILLSTMRDAIRQMPPRIYRNLQHRDDLYLAIIEALEELEDDLEDMEEMEEETVFDEDLKEMDVMQEETEFDEETEALDEETGFDENENNKGVDDE